MTEKNGDEKVKQSEENSESDDKLVESETVAVQQEPPLEDSQPESGASVNDDLAKQEPSIEEVESKKDSNKPESQAEEIAEAGDSEEHLGGVKSEAGNSKQDDHTTNIKQMATDNADDDSSNCDKKSEVLQAGEEIENDRNGEKQQDIEANDKPQNEIQAADQAKENHTEGEPETAAEMASEQLLQEVPVTGGVQDDSATTSTIRENEQQKPPNEITDEAASEEQRKEMPMEAEAQDSNTTGSSHDSEQLKGTDGNKCETAGNEQQIETAVTVASELQEGDNHMVDESQQEKNSDENSNATASGPRQGEKPNIKEEDVGDARDPMQGNEQEIVVLSQEQQDGQAQHEESSSEKPVDLENKETTEEKILNDSTGEGTKGIELSAKENNICDSEVQTSSNKQEGSPAKANDEETGVKKTEASQLCETMVKTVGDTTIAGQQKPDAMQEENKKLKQDIFMMKQQEDAYRIKVLSLEQEVGKLRARKIDNRSQDSLASDSDSYLKQKLAETEKELDTAERKVKDLQLRLKRFAKDDQLKDEKISQMEKEVKELSDHSKKLEQSLAESKRESNNNAAVQQVGPPKNDSKVCVIL
ncbi:enolase-phosphatase E1-like isoform X2 [Montipora foliosa]|uniref:enolase-phosphatase E1-like isoform X2 n=1 Tax=Montipora foliosa TaxID=591990 RepID=UPI0035F18D0F